MKNRKLLYLLMLISLVYSCQQATKIEELKAEYESFNELKDTVASINSDRGQEYVHLYLDSVSANSKNQELALYAKILKDKHSDYDETEKKEIIDELILLKESPFFKRASPHLKYHICNHLSLLYVEIDNELGLNFIIEAEKYIDPYPDIYHFEIGRAYYFIDNFAGKYFDEHEVGKKANRLGLEIALKYNNKPLVLDLMYHAILKRIGNEEYSQAITDANKCIEFVGTEVKKIRLLSLTYCLLAHCYLELEQPDSVKIIDKTYQDLYEQGVFSEEMRAEYLLYRMTDNLEISKTDVSLEQIDYLEDYFFI